MQLTKPLVPWTQLWEYRNCFFTCALHSAERKVQVQHHVYLGLSCTHTVASYTPCVLDSVLRIMQVVTPRVSLTHLYAYCSLIRHVCLGLICKHIVACYTTCVGLNCTHAVDCFTTCVLDSVLRIMKLVTPRVSQTQLYAYCSLLHHVCLGLSYTHNVSWYTTCVGLNCTHAVDCFTT